MAYRPMNDLIDKRRNRKKKKKKNMSLEEAVGVPQTPTRPLRRDRRY